MSDLVSFDTRVALTVLVELSLLVAVYGFVVRRAARRRRATVIFVLAVVALLLLHVVGLEVFVPAPSFGPRYTARQCTDGKVQVTVDFWWRESFFLHRELRRTVSIYPGRSPTATRVLTEGSGTVDLGDGSFVENDELVGVLWPFRDGANLVYGADARPILDAIRSSQIARVDSRVAAIVSAR